MIASAALQPRPILPTRPQQPRPQTIGIRSCRCTLEIRFNDDVSRGFCFAL